MISTVSAQEFNYNALLQRQIWTTNGFRDTCQYKLSRCGKPHLSGALSRLNNV